MDSSSRFHLFPHNVKLIHRKVDRIICSPVVASLWLRQDFFLHVFTKVTFLEAMPQKPPEQNKKP